MLRPSEKFWDKNAAGYDREEMKDRELRLEILRKIKQQLKKEDRVLDFGCATGIVSNEIAMEVDSVTGVDISNEMIRIARENARAKNIPNVTYDTTLNQAGFDVALAVYLLHLPDDLPGTLRLLHAALKPGGRLISVTPCMGKTVAGCALWLLGKTGLIPRFRLFESGELTQTLTLAGFEVAETERLQRRGNQYFIIAKKTG